MQLTINGSLHEVPDLKTLADFANWLQLPGYGNAIELNGEVIRRSEHSHTLLSEGDRLEVVRLVGGG